MVKSLNCPNCGAPYDPSKNFCEYCGSYLVYVDAYDKQPKDLQKIALPKGSKSFVCGVRLNDNEYPIRIGTGAYIKSIWRNISGWLVLTNFRFMLVDFKSNIVLDIPISGISCMDGGTFGLSGNLQFNANGDKFKFNTNGAKEWINKINSIL